MKLTIRALAFAAMLSATATATPALAAPITYVGSQQVESILAEYSIQTDGTLGIGDQRNILSYSVTLSDSRSTLTFGTATGGFTTIFFDATPTTLSAVGLGNQFRQDNTGSGVLTFTGNRAQVQLTDAAGPRAATDAFTNPIATVVTAPAPAVPEPATWAMMLLGMGAVGAALRRRGKGSTTVRFA